MTDENSESSYITEVTEFYCSLAGTVAMLSSEDQHLLMKWKSEGISRQDVLLGIKRAFESGAGTGRLKISGCRRFVEECSVRSRHIARREDAGVPNQNPEAGVHSSILKLSLNLQRALKNADDGNVRKSLENAIRAVSKRAPSGADVWEFFQSLNRQICDDLMSGFEPARLESIRRRALETVLSSGRDFINTKERDRVTAACVDDLIIREAGLGDLFSLSDEVEGDGKVR